MGLGEGGGFAMVEDGCCLRGGFNYLNGLQIEWKNVEEIPIDEANDRRSVPVKKQPSNEVIGATLNNRKLQVSRHGLVKTPSWRKLSSSYSKLRFQSTDSTTGRPTRMVCACGNTIAIATLSSGSNIMGNVTMALITTVGC